MRSVDYIAVKIGIPEKRQKKRFIAIKIRYLENKDV